MIKRRIKRRIKRVRGGKSNQINNDLLVKLIFSYIYIDVRLVIGLTAGGLTCNERNGKNASDS
jgi:hypothetical protein